MISHQTFSDYAIILQLSPEQSHMALLNDFGTGGIGIDVLDFSRFRHGSSEETQQTATKLFEAFRDVGFVYLQNHGLPQETVDKAFDWVRPKDDS